MKRGLLKNFLALTLIFGTISACNLEYFQDAEFGDFVWDPSLAIPVGEITYTIEELFEELNDVGAQVGANSDNIVSINYTEALQSQRASIFLAVLDQNFNGNIQAGVNINNPGVGSTVSLNQTFEYDIEQRSGEEYDSLFFTGGAFALDFTSQIDATVDFTMTVRSLREKATGNPLVVTGTLSPTSPNFNFNNTLGDYDGLFTQDAAGNTSTNKIVMDFAYDITVEPTTVINSSDQVGFSVSLTDAEFQTVFGDIGTSALDVNFEVVNLDFFDNFNADRIRFAEPVIQFDFANSFGFPLGVDFRDISAISPIGEIVPLTGAAIDNPTIVGAPTVDNIGVVVNSQLELNSTNSNIADLLEIQPNKMILQVNAESNPATGPAQYNFVDINSILDVSVNIELPIIANIENLLFEENLDFNNGTDLEEAKRLLLRVITENELPLGGDIEIEFLDAQNNVVFTVSERPVFTGAPVGTDGRTTEVTTTTVDVNFQDADIRAIEGATQIRVLARLSTTDAQSRAEVRFFQDYELKVRLAAQADVEIGASGN